MIDFILWYLLTVLIGLLAFPISFRLLNQLSDHGYALSRPLGLLLWGFTFWILNSLHILQNNSGGALVALLIFAGLSIWFLRQVGWHSVVNWLHSQRHTIIVMEIVFFVSFCGWTIVRATNPEIIGTEKPMELAFINAILRSPAFPPNDPWLSGYAISYYYFGYVIVAILIQMTGTASAVAFNLAGSLWFGLTAVSAYGLLYSLLKTASGIIVIKNNKHDQQSEPTGFLGWSLLAPIFVLVVSNLEGFLEILHSKGLFWYQSVDGKWISTFWKWMGILELENPPTPPFSWLPERISGIWWWRASRVLQDFDIAGQSREIIDEFPFFSYLLADLHPHVLAMPFAILAIGLALNYYLNAQHLDNHRIGLLTWLQEWASGEKVSLEDLRIISWFKTSSFWLAAIVMGGLSFLNTWDFPIYVGLFCAAAALARFEQEGWSNRLVGEFIERGIVLSISGVFLYIPFYLGFASQAGGILPSLSFFSRGINFWVMFAPLLFPLFAWLIWLPFSRRARVNLAAGLKIAVGITAGLWFFSYVVAWLFIGLAGWANSFTNGNGAPGFLGNIAFSFRTMGGLFFGLHGSTDPNVLLLGSLVRRFVSPGAWLTLLTLLTLLWMILSKLKHSDIRERKSSANFAVFPCSATNFVFLMVLFGTGLTLAPEFIYLRDQFGWRMNTIFKLYFQTWILWGIAAAFASVVLWKEIKSAWKWLFRLAWITVFAMSLAYPVFGLWTKTEGFSPKAWSLDGSQHILLYYPDEMEAIHWMNQSPLGTVAEAIGGSYSNYARISTYTGHPTVLGWPGHESQWRGGAREMGSRESDIQKLYNTNSWNEALQIIERYNIRYIYIGSLERSTYRINEAKFKNHLNPVFQNNNVVIYESSDFTD